MSKARKTVKIVHTKSLLDEDGDDFKMADGKKGADQENTILLA